MCVACSGAGAPGVNANSYTRALSWFVRDRLKGEVHGRSDVKGRNKFQITMVRHKIRLSKFHEEIRAILAIDKSRVKSTSGTFIFTVWSP